MLKYQLVIWFICFIFACRFNYTLYIFSKANNLIYKYMDYLMLVNEYNFEIDYCKNMKINFSRYMFSWKWGVYACFKNKYVEITKQPFKERYNKQMMKEILNK